MAEATATSASCASGLARQAPAPSRVFTVIHIHELLAHILPPLGINMKPFFRMHFFFCLS